MVTIGIDSLDPTPSCHLLKIWKVESGSQFTLLRTLEFSVSMKFIKYEILGDSEIEETLLIGTHLEAKIIRLSTLNEVSIDTNPVVPGKKENSRMFKTNKEIICLRYSMHFGIFAVCLDNG